MQAEDLPPLSQVVGNIPQTCMNFLFICAPVVVIRPFPLDRQDLPLAPEIETFVGTRRDPVGLNGLGQRTVRVEHPAKILALPVFTLEPKERAFGIVFSVQRLLFAVVVETAEQYLGTIFKTG